MIVAQQAVATTMPELAHAPLARDALHQLADRVAEMERVDRAVILSGGAAKSTEALHARWVFVWAARIVLYAKDWQVADLLDWSRGRVRSDHRDLQYRIDTDIPFRDRLDKTVRVLFADKGWKQPLVVAVRAHHHANDGRRR